jgi:hypothetical protein
MSRMCWWLVDIVSRLLEPDERDAVRGDFEELGHSSGRALFELVGLVFRRQAAAWKGWRPWLALMGLVVPLATLFSLAAAQLEEQSAVYGWLYLNNWTWAYLGSPGAQFDLARYAGGFCLDYLTLICWSLTGGLALASLSRRAAGVNAALLCVVVIGAFFAAPHSHNPANAEVFSSTLYAIVLPVVLRIALIVIPLVWGARRGLQEQTPSVRQTILWACIIVVFTVRASRNLQMAVAFGLRLYQWRGTWELRLVPLALVWPVAYMVAIAAWRHRRGETAAA